MTNPATISAEQLRPLTHNYYWQNWRDYRSEYSELSKRLYIRTEAEKGVELSFSWFTGPHMTNAREGIQFPLMLHSIGIASVEPVRMMPSVEHQREGRTAALLDILGHGTRQIHRTLSIVRIDLVPLDTPPQALLDKDTSMRQLGVAMVRDVCDREDEDPQYFQPPLPVFYVEE